MVEFVKDHEEMRNLLPNRKEASILFQIKSKLLKPQLKVLNNSWKETEFFMGNLKWRLWIESLFGKIDIGLECLSEISGTFPIKINSRLRILSNGINEIVHSKILSEQSIQNKQGYYDWLVSDYTIHAKYRKSTTVTMEVQINAQTNKRFELDNAIFLEWHKSMKLADVEYKELKTRNQTLEANNAKLTKQVEEMRTITEIQQTTIEILTTKLAKQVQELEDIRTTAKDQQNMIANLETTSNKQKTTIEHFQAHNAKLTQKVEKKRATTRDQQTMIKKLSQTLSYYEEEEENLKVFKEVLCLFKNKCCERFEHEIELNENVKVHLHMVPINMNGSEKQLDNADQEEQINEYKERLQQQEDEIQQLKQDNIQLNQQNSDLIIKSESQNAEIAKLKYESSILTQMNVDLEAINADNTARNQEALDQMMTNIKSINIKNDELKDKLSHLEDDLIKLQVFKEAMRLFEMRCCTVFQNEIELADNIKIHIRMNLNQNDELMSNDEKHTTSTTATERDVQRDDELAKLRLEVQELKV